VLARAAGLDQRADRLAAVGQLLDDVEQRRRRRVAREPAGAAGHDHLAQPADRRAEHGAVVHQRLARDVGPALPQRRHDDRVRLADVARDLAARDGVGEPEAVVAGRHELKLGAQRRLHRAGLRVAAQQREPDVVAGRRRHRPHEVLDALAPLGSPEVEQLERAVGSRRRRVLAAGRQLDQERVGDAYGGREPRPVVAAVGVQDVAARPQQAVRVAQDVALGVVHGERRRVARHVAVEHRADLRRGVRAHGHERPLQPRIQRVLRLDGDEALGEVVAELDQVRPAVRERGAQGGVDVRGVRVHERQEGADLPGLGLRHPGHPHGVGKGPATLRAQPLVLRAVRLGGDQRDLGDLGEEPRGRRHDGRDAPADVRIDLTRYEGDAHAA
jgi:hypothetical protein